MIVYLIKAEKINQFYMYLQDDIFRAMLCYRRYVVKVYGDVSSKLRAAKVIFFLLKLALRWS